MKLSKLAYSMNDLLCIAEKTLKNGLDPIPKYRIQKNILGKIFSRNELQEIHDEIRNTKWVRVLENEQLDNGTWGRFHSQDSSIKKKIPTTENGIRIAIESCLEKNSAILQKTIYYIEQHLEHKVEWTDPMEKHDNPKAWPIEIRNISAANLALIDSQHKGLDLYWNYWNEVVEKSFDGKIYDRKKEVKIRNKKDNCERKNPYPFHVLYPLLILSSTTNTLKSKVEENILNYVMNNKKGIYYVYGKKINNLISIKDKTFYSWIQAQMLLSRFHGWKYKAIEALNSIWTQKLSNDFWDIGNDIAKKPFTCFPLSESWHYKKNKLSDVSIVILELLKNGLDGI